MKSVVGCLMASLAFIAGGVGAQYSTVITDNGVKAQSGNGNSASITSGTVADDVEMTGVAVINSDVFIDGVKVPRGKSSYTSKKTGKSYRIEWGKDGNVSVAEK